MDEVDKIANRILREYSRLRQNGNTEVSLLDRIIEETVVRSGFVGESKSFAHSNIKKIVGLRIQGKK